MKAKAIVLTLALCFVGVALGYATDAFMGTWKLNEAKSKFAPGSRKNNTVVYEAAGDNVKVTADGTDSDGKPAHNEWTGKFDGKDYPVKGTYANETVSLKKLSDRSIEATFKRDGKVESVDKITVSPDGKKMTTVADNKRLGRVSTLVDEKQ